MAKFDNKISNLIPTQLPDFVVDDHPKFVEFLKTYFQFMEAAELQVTSIQTTDGITLENQTGVANNLVLDGGSLGAEHTQLDLDDKIILEDSTYGKFTFKETITGQTSKATATVLTEDLDNNRLFISSQDKFIVGEIVVGTISNASAVVNLYRPNPVNTIQQLTNFRDPDKVISNFLDSFRDEFFQTIPENLASGLNKRNLIKNIKSLYKLKGTQKGHELFFRILFNDSSETFYPRENLMKVSDGKWDTKTVLRVIATQGNTSSLVGRKITGNTSKATAIIEHVTKFHIGASEVSEVTINKDTIIGTFQVDEEIQGTATDTDDYYILANISGIPGTKTITNDGNLYTTDDIITVTGGGEQAAFQVSDVGSGKLTEVIVDAGGSGYEIGDELSFVNTGTFGSGAKGVVTVVNGAVAHEDTDHVVLEDQTTSGDHLTGDKIVFESDTGTGDITDVYLYNGGDGYKTLPTVTVTSSAGANANLLSYGTEVGKVLGITTTNLGIKYQNSPTPPTLSFVNNLFLIGVTGSFGTGLTLTGASSGATGLITDWDSDRNILKLKNVSGTFQLNETVSTGGGDGTLKYLDLTTINVDVAAVVDTDGTFLNEKGYLSENTMKVQDSKYYQDYSYVLKVGNSINLWRDAFKKTMHTAGFYFTGQVDLESRINMQVSIAEALNTGTIGEPIISMMKLIFSTVFGRRLGTIDDGTSLREDPWIASTEVINPYFPSTTRAVTLTRAPIGVKLNLRLRRKVGTNKNINQGFAYCGPRFASINKWANTAYGVTGNRSTGINGTTGITFDRLNELKVIGTRSSLDGTTALLNMISGTNVNEDDNGFMLKTNFTFPADITFPGEKSFSGNTNTFDSRNETWDQYDRYWAGDESFSGGINKWDSNTDKFDQTDI
jgi:hypothetical protein